MKKEQKSQEPHKQTLNISDVKHSLSHIKVNLRYEDIEGMISTYEFLVWDNEGEDKKHCQRILRQLKKALE